MRLLLALLLLIFTLPSFAEAKKDDAYYMRLAIEVAKQNPHAPFGAVIVDNQSGKVLAKGVNAVMRLHNPTLHGEMVAINNFVNHYPKAAWKNTTLYTTCEPCAMCQSAIIWTGISRVVFGTSTQFISEHGWDQIKLSAEEVNKSANFYTGSVTGGVLANETNQLFIQNKHGI